MGLIKEPKNVDFTVLDKLWTDEERKELSDYIQKKKAQRSRRTTQTLSKNKIGV